MVEWSWLDRDRHLGRIGLGVNIVRKSCIPVAKAMSRVCQPAEIAVGAATQRLLGNRGSVLERLKLGDLLQQISELAILDAGDLGSIVQISAGNITGNNCRCDQCNHQVKPSNPHPAPVWERLSPTTRSSGGLRLPGPARGGCRDPSLQAADLGRQLAVRR